MADFSLGFQLFCNLIGTGTGVKFIPFGADGMQKIKIKIVHAAGFQLGLEEGQNLLFFLETAAGKLVGKQVPIPGVTAG